ncbi:MAG: 30S ribosomal protein S3 [Actinomycetota bacterium]
MGQKVNPYGFRLGIINDWRTRWYNEKEFAAYLDEDIKIRRHIQDKLKHAGLAKVEIERTEQQVKIVIHAGRPGIVIGKKGVEVDKLRNHLEKLTGKHVRVDIQEVRRPEISAPLIAQNVAQQLEGRVSFRRAMKRSVSQAMAGGIKGIRISSAGRLGGNEMSRTEWYREGRVPLHTLKADIEYGTAEADTKSGKIGVKVWIYLGDVDLRGTSIRHESQQEVTDSFIPRPFPARPPKKAETAEQKEVPEKVAAKAAKVEKPVEKVAKTVKTAKTKKPSSAKALQEKPTAKKAPAKKPASAKAPAGKPEAKKVTQIKKTVGAGEAKKVTETKKAPTKNTTAKSAAKMTPAKTKKPATKKPASAKAPSSAKATEGKPAGKKTTGAKEDK